MLTRRSLVPTLFCIAALVASSAAEEAPVAALKPAPHRETPAWFREARFGLFIHWGVYAVPAGEWQGKPVKSIGEWIMKNGAIPVADYRAFAARFTAAHYDPVAWARLAREAGVRYVVITAKHHDGFALFDSAVTEWDVANSGAKRDLLAPLAAAVRAEGLKFGTYYSQAQDWNHPGGAIAGGKGPWDPAQKGDFDDYLRTISLPQVREIITKFQPDVLWWDTPTDMNAERAKPFAELLTQHPEIVTNNRLGGGYPGDTKTPEQNIPPRGYPGEMFEVCMTMNDTWGFKRDDHNWKSVRQLLRQLSDISSKGGNFLLNVGPTAEGEIPAESIERLQAMGRWMKVNGEAIYATEAGPFVKRLPWGRVTQKHAADGSCTLYLHVWEWPTDGKLLLPTVKQKPKRGVVLATRATVTTSGTKDGAVVQLSGSAPDADVSVVRLDFAGPVEVQQNAANEPEADGVIRFGAFDFDTHGHYDGNVEVRGSGTDAYLANWKNARWRVECLFKTAQPGRWRVFAELTASEASRLKLKAGGKEQSADIAATGPDLTWKEVALGDIDLPAGSGSLSLQGDEAAFRPLNLRRIRLVPLPTNSPSP